MISAARFLDWHPRWDFNRTIRETVDWYRAASDRSMPHDFRGLTVDHIIAYSEQLPELN